MDRGLGASAKSVQPRPASSRAQAENGSGSGSTVGTAGVAVTTPGIAAQQLQERALRILANNQLLLRFALANDLSVPKVRVYFEQLAGGFEPKPIISKWDVFDD